MQTFLPYADFAESARVLDRQRLGKQRVETLQIMKALVTGTGWVNHPATRMWRRSEETLLDYQRAITNEWLSRGYRDTCYGKTFQLLNDCTDRDRYRYMNPPVWHGDHELHRSHRSNLLRKLPEHYGPLFEAGLPDDLPYVWPV